MLTGKMTLGEFTIDKRAETEDTRAGNFISGPGIVGYIFRADDLEAIALQRTLNAVYVAGWNARARD